MLGKHFMKPIKIFLEYIPWKDVITKGFNVSILNELQKFMIIIYKIMKGV